MGHQPARELSPQDETLFRAFQNNLLSLISHELRTPLMGILNAVTLLDEAGPDSSIPSAELITMARQNAHRLQASLTMLLDLASIESGSFHAHLREVELQRLVRGRLELHRSAFRDRGLTAQEKAGGETVALGDSMKLARAVDLCLESIVFRAKAASAIQIRISSSPVPRVEFEFELEPGGEKAWQQAWSHGLAGFAGGVGSPSSAFGGAFRGVLQSEEAFLTRTEEGLGSEFLLIHEVMRLHRGKLEQKRDGCRVTLALKLADFSSEEALQAILTSRAYELSNEVTSVALVLVRVPKGQDIEAFRGKVKGLLYRTTDGAYLLPDSREIAVVMDDYRKADMLKFLNRLKASLGKELPVAMVHCPDDVADPGSLFKQARQAMVVVQS